MAAAAARAVRTAVPATKAGAVTLAGLAVPEVAPPEAVTAVRTHSGRPPPWLPAQTCRSCSVG